MNMSYLYIINEYITNNYKIELLNIIFIFSIFCGVLVIISKNPIVSVLFLIGLFSSISLYLIILGLSFIGLSYLIVYIGAVSILFLFILMLINIRISELHINSNNSIALGITITIIFYYIIDQLLPKDVIYEDKTNIINNNKIQFSTSNMWDGNLLEINHITSIGNIMYTNYNIWLIISSFILLLAMVGAIIITIKQK